MILLWGIPSEPPVQLAAEAAQRRGTRYAVVNQRHAADDDIVVDAAAGSGRLQLDGRRIDLDDVSGIYVRIMDPHRTPEARADTPDRRDRSAALHAMLLAWVDGANCRVANPTGAMATNGSKPYQAQLIGEAGFRSPVTLITNDVQEVLLFEREHGDLVYKSISSVRSIVRPFDTAARDRLRLLRHLPVQFQRRERGTDVRVHVIGEVVLAAQATTEAVDYRYAAREGEDLTLERTQLPEDIATRCRDLARRLGLPFCGIDLMRCTDGTWVCFEVNPSPGYSWYEQQADLPISDALVGWLAGDG